MRKREVFKRNFIHSLIHSFIHWIKVAFVLNQKSEKLCLICSLNLFSASIQTHRVHGRDCILYSMFTAVVEVFERCFGRKGTVVVAFASQETAVLRWWLSETRKFDMKEIDKRQTTPVIRLRSTPFKRCALHSCFFFFF